MIKQTYLLICILLALCITACQDYTDDGTIPSVVDGNKIEVTIRTAMPALTIQTRADGTQSTVNERKLNHVDILVFEVDEENDKEVFAYRTTNTNNLETLEYDGSEIEITAKLNISKEGEKYRVVFIANLKEEVNNAFGANDANIQKGITSKEDVLEKITFEQTTKWETGDDFRLLPMWGETATATTINKSTTTIGEIKLLRSVAHIGVSVNINSTNGSDIFVIQEVKVYNARKEGLAAPYEKNFTDGKAVAPSLIDNTGIIESAIVYDDVENNYLTEIYINEATNQTEGVETSDALYLIIKAIYKDGEYADNDTPTYYKVGFYNMEEKPVDILRNHTYNMIISGVKGPGEEDEEEAKKAGPKNLIVNMINWSDGQMNHVVFNNQYYLAVSESTITVPKAEGKHSLLVETNYPGGWSAEVTEGSDWLTNVTPGSSINLETKETVTFDVDENDEGDTRTGVITFSCRNQLELEVHIKQTVEEEISLKIQVKNANGEYVDLDDNTLLFHSGNHYEIEPYELKVTWTPTNLNLIVDFDRDFDWGEANDLHTFYDENDGIAYMKIVPARMMIRPANDDPLEAWFPSEETDIQIQVGGHSDTQQTIFVKKQHYEIYIDRSDRYKMDGEKHSFKLYSNSKKWTALFGDTDGIYEYIDINNIQGQENPPVGGNNIEGKNDMDEAGEFIEFILNKPAQGSSINAEVVIKVIYDDLGRDITKEYVFRAYYEDEESQYIAGGEANCYVLEPSGKQIHIPVRQANQAVEFLGIQIDNSTELNPLFIWTDHPGGYGKKTSRSDAPVIDMKIEGSGPDAMLVVTPGSEAGNAVVGITNASGTILWSWHIWVVNDFDPYNEHEDRHAFRKYEFLDRNIGALEEVKQNQVTQKSLGLYYQWGRKDPFPSASTVGGTTFAKIYDENGNEIQIKKERRPDSYWGDGKIFLENTIRNPLTFVTHSDAWLTGDFSTHQVAATQLWNENETSDLENATKGVFDPCPDGWKTIPASLNPQNQWYALFAATTYNSAGYSAVTRSASDPTNYLKEDADLGFWPHAGYINGSDGSLTSSTSGRYWTGNKDPGTNHQAHHCHFETNSNSHPGLNLASVHGMTVRCMRRTDYMR